MINIIKNGKFKKNPKIFKCSCECEFETDEYYHPNGKPTIITEEFYPFIKTEVIRKKYKTKFISECPSCKKIILYHANNKI